MKIFREKSGFRKRSGFSRFFPDFSGFQGNIEWYYVTYDFPSKIIIFGRIFKIWTSVCHWILICTFRLNYFNINILFQITFNLHSLRWRRSRCYIRLGLLLLILIFCIPYDSFSLYYLLSPIQNEPAAVQTTPSLQNSNSLRSFLATATAQSNENVPGSTISWTHSAILAEILENARNNQKKEAETAAIKCYENLTDVDWILDASRYTGSAISFGPA